MATHFNRYPCVGALTGELTVQRPYRTFLTAVQFCEWKVRGGACRVGRTCGRPRARCPQCVHEAAPASPDHLPGVPLPPAVLQVSHLLQKPIESICGFLTVLPGAFCAFRWAAVEVRRARLPWPALAWPA